MPHEKFKPPYSVFAEFYDQIAAPLRAPNLRAREKILLPLLLRESRTPSPESRLSLCDLCCGTGTTALEFARRGMRVYAVDGSRDMLKVARSKFAQARLPVRAIRADMRTFRLPELADLVTCEFDAINHLKRKGDLQSVARAVARALRPGGWFFFRRQHASSFPKALGDELDSARARFLYGRARRLRPKTR